MSPRTILIMAGGTGGHIFPALAVANELRRRGVAICWLGTRRGLEVRIVPRQGLKLRTISVVGLRGKGMLRWLSAPFVLLVAVMQAIWIILRERPLAALGMGGFSAGPGGLAAALLRVPLLLHEQNAMLGFTNRWLAPFAWRVMEAFPGTFGRPGAVLTGNPVRATISAIPEPSLRLAHRVGPLRLLVLGGSQGARALNQLVPDALARLDHTRFEIWHQCGDQHRDETDADYARRSLRARVDTFVEDMAAAYEWADLALCRAGALTLAELSAAGVAAILVPFPYAVDDHQSANARYLAAAGAAIVIQQSALDADRLATLLAGFADDRARLLAMSRAARACAQPDADRRVAELCLDAAHG